MRRRDFIAILGGVAVGWPPRAFAQQPERVRRIGVLMNAFGPDDPEGQARIVVFREVLERLGWTDGHNVRIELRLAANDANLMRAYATELVGLAPEVIVGGRRRHPRIVAAGDADDSDRIHDYRGSGRRRLH